MNNRTVSRGRTVTAVDSLATLRAEHIRAGIVAFAELQTTIAEAYRCRDWETLGYQSWTAYVAGEFGEHRLKLTTSQRRALTSSLHTEGVSIRAISTALGVARNTVRADLRGVGQSDPPSEEEEATRRAWWFLMERFPVEHAVWLRQELDVPEEAAEMARAVLDLGDEALQIDLWHGRVSLEDAYQQVTKPATDSLRADIERLASSYGVALNSDLLAQLLADQGGSR